MGSVAEWISALAALGALIAAVYAGKAAWRLFEIESERDERTLVVRREAQARQVSAWVGVSFDEESQRYSGVEIVNGSTAPVYDVEVLATNKDGELRPPLTMTVLPPGRFQSSVSAPWPWTFPDPSDQPLRPVTRKPEWRVERLRFRDSANVHWARDATGRLAETDAEGNILQRRRKS